MSFAYLFLFPVWNCDEAGDGYTCSLGAVWLDIADIWYNHERRYGQLLLSTTDLEMLLANLVNFQCHAYPHFSFRIDEEEEDEEEEDEEEDEEEVGWYIVATQIGG